MKFVDLFKENLAIEKTGMFSNKQPNKNNEDKKENKTSQSFNQYLEKEKINKFIKEIQELADKYNIKVSISNTNEEVKVNIDNKEQEITSTKYNINSVLNNNKREYTQNEIKNIIKKYVPKN